MKPVSFILRHAAIIAAVFLTTTTRAQNPVPQIVGPVQPTAVIPGGGEFALTVYGANFVPGAVVNWNGQARSTTFVSARELHAQILATDVATNTAGLISVTNPPPGGGNSSAGWQQVEVHTPISTIALKAHVLYNTGVFTLMTADFNNDHILDFLGGTGPLLTYYPGKGDGTFQFKSFTGFNYAQSLPTAYGDFNNDGNLDYIYSDTPSYIPNAAAAVWLGNGKGEFSFASEMSRSEISDQTFAVGDFNGDGNLDIVTGISLDDSTVGFTLLLGNGDGSFRQAGIFGDGIIGIHELVAGDFNGDGKLDVADFVNPGGGDAGNYLNIFLGNGDGTFQAPLNIVSTTSSFGLVGELQASDFNGDGKLDLAYRSTLTQIAILLGNGDGTFQPPIFVDAGQTYYVFTIADFNADGKPDLLVSDYITSERQPFLVLLGNGDGTFQAPQSLPGAYGGLGLAAGDLNSDGLPDLINLTGAGALVYLQK